jgi:hypothetical protein
VNNSSRHTLLYSATHVYKERPTFGWCSRITQLTYCGVQGIRNVIKIKMSRSEQDLVEVKGNFRCVFVADTPAEFELACDVGVRENSTNSPHCAYDAAKPAKQHGSCKMHSLVWCFLVPLGRPASAQKCEYCLREIHSHDVGERELSILE